MPRIRVDPEADARAAFTREIRVKRATYEVKQYQLAQALDVGAPRMSALLARPDDLTVERLRGIIKILHLDPAVVLAFLGYSQKEIRKAFTQQNLTGS